MKQLTFFLLFIVVAHAVSAQNRLICETDENTVNRQEYYYNTLFEQQLVAQKQYNGIEWIPMQIHILVRNDGSGWAPLDRLQWEIDTLNARFGRGNMQFFQCGPVRYIKNSALYDSSFSSNKTHSCGANTPEFQLAANNVPNVVNIYLIDSSNTSHAHFPSDRTSQCADWIILNKQQLQWYGVLAHEMGHYLDLFHTFNGARRAADREHITRNASDPCYNCLTIGDLLCDTQADPDTSRSGSWNAACAFTMTTRDTSCGNGLFTPWSENIMSYSGTCSHFFTNGQFTRMKAAVAGSRSYLSCGDLSECYASLNLTSTPITNAFYYQAENSIVSTASAQNTNYLVYDAGSSITLSPGFVSTAAVNKRFDAFIDGCYGDRVFERQGTGDTITRVEIVATKYTVQSELYCNLPADQPYSLVVSNASGAVVYKMTFRNFSKAKATRFFHQARDSGIQKVIISDSTGKVIYTGQVPI